MSTPLVEIFGNVLDWPRATRASLRSLLADIEAAESDLAAHVVDTDAHDASAISYDGDISGVVANDVQGAIDETYAAVVVAQGAADAAQVTADAAIPLAQKAAASGVASLDGSSLVVQNPANATATPTASKIPKADGSGKLAAGWGGSASTLATLNSSSLVVENPANATATPTASKIVIADGGGKVDGWVSAAGEATAGKVELATQAEVDTGTNTTAVVTPATLRATLKHRASMTRAAAQSINNNAATKIAFDTITYDVIGGVADATTNDRFDIARTGYYHVEAYWIAAGIDDAEYASVDIYLNGVSTRRGIDVSPSSNYSLGPLVSRILYLVSGDYLEMYVQHIEGAAINTQTSDLGMPRMSIAELL